MLGDACDILCIFCTALLGCMSLYHIIYTVNTSSSAERTVSTVLFPIIRMFLASNSGLNVCYTH